MVETSHLEKGVKQSEISPDGKFFDFKLLQNFDLYLHRKSSKEVVSHMISSTFESIFW